MSSHSQPVARIRIALASTTPATTRAAVSFTGLGKPKISRMNRITEDSSPSPSASSSGLRAMGSPPSRLGQQESEQPHSLELGRIRDSGGPLRDFCTLDGADAPQRDVMPDVSAR